MHKVCSIHLCLWENILIGQSCWLSCCEVWNSSNLEILPFLFKVLGEFVLIKYKTKVSHTPQFGEQFLRKLNMTSCKFQAFHICCRLLCWVWSSLIDHCWEIYHAPKIKITYTPHTHATPTPGVCKNMLPSRSTKNSAPTLGVDKNMFDREILHVLKRQWYLSEYVV